MYQWDHASLRQSNRADILAIMLTAERCISGYCSTCSPKLH